jgi:hypothetical protein
MTFCFHQKLSSEEPHLRNAVLEGCIFGGITVFPFFSRKGIAMAFCECPEGAETAEDVEVRAASHI